MSILPLGYGSVIVNVFYFKAGEKGKKDTFRPINPNYLITDFEYKYAEDEDDEACITIETDDRTIADRPEFQQGACLKLIWGYIKGAQSKARTVFIRDTDFEGEKHEKIKLKLSCSDKASLMKDSSSQQLHSAETGNEDDKITALMVAHALCRKYGLVLHMEGTTFDFRVDPNLSPLDSKIPANWKSEFLPLNDKTSPNAPVSNGPGQSQKFIRYQVYPQANKSDYQLIWELMQSQPGGPYYVTGRDNTLQIGSRKLTQKPYRSYTYEGGNGELLSFKIKEKGQLTESESQGIATVAWDDKKKTFVSNASLSQNTPSDKTGEFSKTGIATELVGGALAAKFLANRLTGTSIGTAAAEVGTGAACFYAILAAVATYTIIGSYNQLQGGLNNNDPAFHISEQGVITERVLGPGGAIYIKTSIPKGNRENLSAQDIVALANKKTNPQDFEQSLQLDTAANNLLAQIRNSNIDPTRLPTPIADAFASLGLTTRYSNQHNMVAAQAEAENQRKDNALNNFTASAIVLGDPRIEDKQNLTLLGIGKKYSGNYYIKKCKHKINPHEGFEVLIEEMNSNSQGKPEEPTIKPINNSQLPGNINIIIGNDEPASDRVIVPVRDGNHAFNEFHSLDNR